MPDKFPLELGKKMGECCPCPTSPGEYYPTLYIDLDQPIEFPVSGVMTVRFVRERSSTTISKGGKEAQSVSLEIKKIISVKADKLADEESEEDSGKALDRLKEEEMGEEED